MADIGNHLRILTENKMCEKTLPNILDKAFCAIS